MKSTAVRLYIRIRGSDESRLFALPVLAGNGRLPPQYALIDGQPRHCPEGVYHLRYSRGGKCVWESVGADPHLALLARDRTQCALCNLASGVIIAGEQPSMDISLAENIVAYLADVKFTKSPKTLAAYAETLRGFAGSTAQQSLRGLGRKDVLAYTAPLRSKATRRGRYTTG